MEGFTALFHRKIESTFLHCNPEILAKLFNLIYFLTLILTPQLSPNPNYKHHVKCAQMNIA